MPIRKYSLASLPDRRVHRQASPALRHLVVAHSTLQGVFESLHIVRLAAADASGEDARGRLNEGEVDLLRSALVLAGSGLDAVLKRLAQDALPELLAVGSTRAAADKAFKAHVSAQIRDKTPSTAWTKAILDPDPRQAMIRAAKSSKPSTSRSSGVKACVCIRIGSLAHQVRRRVRIGSCGGTESRSGGTARGRLLPHQDQGPRSGCARYAATTIQYSGLVGERGSVEFRFNV